MATTRERWTENGIRVTERSAVVLDGGRVVGAECPRSHGGNHAIHRSTSDYYECAGCGTHYVESDLQHQWVTAEGRG